MGLFSVGYEAPYYHSQPFNCLSRQARQTVFQAQRHNEMCLLANRQSINHPTIILESIWIFINTLFKICTNQNIPVFQSVHYTNIQINKRCYQKLATQFHGKTVSWFLKTKTSRLRFLPSLFGTCGKLENVVSLLCIKCRHLKKRFSTKLSMCFYIVTSWNRISQVFQIKKKTTKPKSWL